MAKKKYNPKTFPKRAEKYARDGLIDIQIAAKLGISHDTYYKYQKEHPEFSEAIKRGKSVIDQDVENALLKRALGYEYDEIRTEIFEDQNQAKTGDKKTDKAGTKKHVTKVTKKVLSDSTAAIFWLKNRRPDLWRDKQEVEHSGNVTLRIDEDEAAL
jgi:hypothetical protein